MHFFNLDDYSNMYYTIYCCYGYSTPAGKRFQQLQNQLEQCQEENYKLESGKSRNSCSPW